MDLSKLIQDVFESTDEVINRIFNHKPFLQAQIQTMARVFDLADGDQINEINEKIVHVKDNLFKSLEDKCQPNLEKTRDHADQLEIMMSQLLANEQNKESERQSKLSQFTSEQNEDLVKFMEQTNEKIDEIDVSYMNAKRDIDAKYKSFIK